MRPEFLLRGLMSLDVEIFAVWVFVGGKIFVAISAKIDYSSVAVSLYFESVFFVFFGGLG